MYEARSAVYIQIYKSIVIELFLIDLFKIYLTISMCNPLYLESNLCIMNRFEQIRRFESTVSTIDIYILMGAKCVINPCNAELFLYKPWRTKGFSI